MSELLLALALVCQERNTHYGDNILCGESIDE